MSPIDLIALGDLVADLVVPIEHLPLEAQMHQPAKYIHLEAGGTGNTLIMGQRLGLRTKTLGSVGDDRFGQWVLELLAAEGIDITDAVTIPNATTTTSLVLVDREAQHVFVGKFGNGAPLAYNPRWMEALSNAKALFLSGYSLRENGSFSHECLQQALQIGHNAGVPLFFDLGPAFTEAARLHVADVLRFTSHFLATEEEIVEWTSLADPLKAARYVLARGPSTIIVKLGGAGCRIITEGEDLFCPGFDVAVRDTAGAGDAFVAGCIYAHLHNYALDEMGRLANAVGAATVARLGTGTALPHRGEVDAVLDDIVLGHC